MKRAAFALVAALSGCLVIAACTDPVEPAALLTVEAAPIAGEPGAFSITALNAVDGVVWFTCTQPRFVIERRVSGEWVDYQSAGGMLCDELGPFPLSPGEDLVQFAQLLSAGTYRFGVFAQEESDAEAAGEVVYSNTIVFQGSPAQAD